MGIDVLKPNSSTPNTPPLAPSEDNEGEREEKNAGNNEASTSGDNNLRGETKGSENGWKKCVIW